MDEISDWLENSSAIEECVNILMDTTPFSVIFQTFPIYLVQIGVKSHLDLSVSVNMRCRGVNVS